jgi:colanic acid/amylovoran biosynthesis glycosyltransferase
MSEKMKIVYILTRFPKHTETFILAELYWLKKSGVDINIFSLLGPQPSTEHQQEKELMKYVHYSPSILSTKLIFSQFYFIFRAAPRYISALVKTIWCTYREPKTLLRMLLVFPLSVYFARQMEELEIDHIHAHFVWLNGLSAMIISTLIDKTFSLHPHAFGLFGRDQINVRRQLERASKIITISEYHRNYIAAMSTKINKDDIEVVHCGVDTDQFKPATYSPSDKPVHFLSIGRLIEKKGFSYLIDACAILAEKDYKFQCSIVGFGSLQELLQAQIDQHNLSDKVTLLGKKNHVEIPDLFRKSDIFVLPCVVSKNGDRDGIPVVLMEAMAMKIPVITTPVTGIPDLVHTEENGLLVPEKDVSALAKALERLIIDETLRQALGEKGRTTVMDEFNISTTTAKLLSVFKTL